MKYLGNMGCDLNYRQLGPGWGKKLNEIKMDERIVLRDSFNISDVT